MSESKLEGYFFTALYVAVFVLVGFMFLPYVGALATGIVLATLAYPLFDRTLKWCRRPSLSASIVTLVVTLAILLPAIGIFMLMLEEARTITHTVGNMDISSLPNSLEPLLHKITDAFPVLLNINLENLLQQILTTIGGGITSLIVFTADALLQLFITIFALFFFLRDGKFFLNKLIALSPLSDDEDVIIVNKLRKVSVSLIRGTLVIAVLQGIVLGIGLTIFGVPNPILWASVATISSIIPTIGTAVVAVPASLFLLFTGQLIPALGFIAWSALLAGTIDDVVRPKLIGDNAQIHPLFVLLSVLGGIIMFGPAGFLIGPLVFGLLIALSEIYIVKIKQIHDTT
jgi:predicted PurR-regulated permease PerM